LLDRLTARQFAEWIAYLRIRGLPEDRNDFRAGQICATFANAFKSKDSRWLLPTDFIAQRDLTPEDDGSEEPAEPVQVDLQAMAEPFRKLLRKTED